MSEERDHLKDLTLEAFQGRIGETFRVVLADGEIALSLATVQRLTEGEGETRGRVPFSLLFRGGPPNRYLPQRTYDVAHDGLGTLPIFLVPLGPDAQGMRYEAIFT